MHDQNCAHHTCRHSNNLPPANRWLRGWLFWWTMISGALALAWLVLRSGPRPSRFAYPCQQASLSAATLAFGAPIVSAVLAFRRKVRSLLIQPTGIAVALIGLTGTALLWQARLDANTYGGPTLDPPADYRATIYQVTDCPEQPVDGRFIGMDTLVRFMGRHGCKLHNAPEVTRTSGPDGLIEPDDVVVIKINYQWSQRGGTNTDVLRGLIHCILDHPSGFVGEVVVCENDQSSHDNNLDRDESNAEDHGQSPHDVVTDFQDAGAPVSQFDWSVHLGTQVNEFADGDTTDGYIVYEEEFDPSGHISYPKFTTDAGYHVSLKYGVWDPESETYDRNRLTFINLPVLKPHGIYAVTACVKHHMGTVTGGLGTHSHSGIADGVLGAMLAEIQMADLNILDAIWVNDTPGAGPHVGYDSPVRRNLLLASTDPIALDIWATKHILVPGYIENGHTSPPWRGADPDDPTSTFRSYLDRSMNYILAAGFEATNDLAQIDTLSWDGRLDFDNDGDIDVHDFAEFSACMEGPDIALSQRPCRDADLDGDWHVDLSDFATLQNAHTGSND